MWSGQVMAPATTSAAGTQPGNVSGAPATALAMNAAYAHFPNQAGAINAAGLKSVPNKGSWLQPPQQ